MFANSLLLAAVLPVLSLAKSLPGTVLDQLPHGTWLENIAARPNGDLLATQMWPSAIVYTIKKPTGPTHKIEELVSIPEIQSIYGIDQVPKGRHGKETYIVVGGNSSNIGVPVIGTFSAFAIEFGCETSKPKVKRISNFNTKSAFLNGVTAIPGVSKAVLVADSANGFVGYLDLKSGKWDTSAFVFPEMAPKPNATLPVGVNGIRAYNGYLYFSNSFAVSIYRIPITPSGYPVKGAKPKLVSDFSDKAVFVDDFAIDTEGNIWAASNFDNKVVYINTKTGTSKVVVGGDNEMIVAGDTAVAFGRGKYDKDFLYVATSGALAMPVGGENGKTEGAKIVAVDTSAH
ncbi:hypothetical protein B0T10DRAFT_490303 [Thelonectria olida]|uniref:SMP-30/Gluconolactonase/LRE-like region domain-containing protein n=1 Tax=Thelonectria olida TaxID=1576542 RepID=A0A9P8W5E5_9HYPO|nr:hypothetical protein B0T10DRAFT_490303 [Thelonectria olida]